MAYVDKYEQEYDFAQVDEYFRSKENLLYMRTKIEIEKYFILILEQDGKELVEMRLRKAERSNAKKKVGEPRDLEVLRVDQFLDNQMKV